MLSLLKVRFVLKQTVYQNQNNKAGMFFLLFYTSRTSVQVSIVIHEMRTAAIHSLTLPQKLKISTHISSWTHQKHNEKYAVNHSVQLQIQIRDWFRILKSVTYSTAFDGSEVLGPFLQKQLGQLKTKTTSACIQLNSNNIFYFQVFKRDLTNSWAIFKNSDFASCNN